LTNKKRLFYDGIGMKKLIVTLLSVGSYLGLATSAFAQANVNPCGNGIGQFGNLCNLNANSIGPIVGAAVAFILVVAALIALFFLIWGGIRWIMSAGDKAKVDSARQTITAAIIGLVIAFLAFFILSLALSFFGLSLNSLTLPKIPNT
jgi:Type IV secretion system pilin